MVVEVEAYERLTAPRDLVDFFQNSPLAEAVADGEIDLDAQRRQGWR